MRDKNAKLNGVNTSGKLYVDWPDFEVDPMVIYVGIVNEVEVMTDSSQVWYSISG